MNRLSPLGLVIFLNFFAFFSLLGIPSSAELSSTGTRTLKYTLSQPTSIGNGGRMCIVVYRKTITTTTMMALRMRKTIPPPPRHSLGQTKVKDRHLRPPDRSKFPVKCLSFILFPLMLCYHTIVSGWC